MICQSATNCTKAAYATRVGREVETFADDRIKPALRFSPRRSPFCQFCHLSLEAHDHYASHF